ncbi:PH domain-containing protein, partial [Patescibacteria group bacterium]|nr:PH domain-containing protein [Patescibacteria group bacterium]
KSHKEKTLYLFNDMLLLTKMKRKNKYEVERKILLINCKVDEKEGMINGMNKGKILMMLTFPDDRFLFSLVTPDGEEFLFSSHDKRSWIQILSSTMKKLHSPAVLNDLLGRS